MYICIQVILTMAKTVLVRSVKCFLDIDFSESPSVHDVMPRAKATQTLFVIDRGHLFVVSFVCYTVLRNMLCVWLQFNKEAGKEVHEAKLRVLYVSPPQPPSPITESSEEGLSPTMEAAVDNGDRQFPPLDPVELSFLLFSALKICSNLLCCF